MTKLECLAKICFQTKSFRHKGYCTDDLHTVKTMSQNAHALKVLF